MNTDDRIKNLLIFSGTPSDSSEDFEYAEFFKNFVGKKIICGGSTASYISRELKIPIKMPNAKMSIDGLPPSFVMDGVNLVTEGVVTLSKVVEYLKSGRVIGIDNPAGKLVEFLIDSDFISFVVGTGLNMNKINVLKLKSRKEIIDEIVLILQKKYSKKVSVQYI